MRQSLKRIRHRTNLVSALSGCEDDAKRSGTRASRSSLVFQAVLADEAKRPANRWSTIVTRRRRIAPPMGTLRTGSNSSNNLPGFSPPQLAKPPPHRTVWVSSERIHNQPANHPCVTARITLEKADHRSPPRATTLSSSKGEPLPLAVAPRAPGEAQRLRDVFKRAWHVMVVQGQSQGKRHGT